MRNFHPLQKLIALVVLFIIYHFSLFTIVLAEDFSTSYDTTYDVQTNGITNITQKITLKNLTSQYYVSNFTLTIGSTAISDVIASDEQGNMETKIETKDTKTSITVRLNSQVAGLEKTQSLTLKFKSKDFAQSLGKTWEVNLPKIPAQGQIDAYNLVLSVPVSFGDPTSISPKPNSESQTFERLFFSYSKDSLKQSGVSVNFGTSQIYDFIIKYPLENNSLFPVLTPITLPPDTAYQEVFISKITPPPLNVTIDEDGNYLAWYRLSRGSKFEVQLSGSIKNYIKSKVNSLKKLTPFEISSYTKSDRYWEADNPTVKNTIAEIFKNGEPGSNQEKARLIYLYVVNFLSYNTSRVNDESIQRLGAITILNNPNQAICMEFTDLFIALTRAAGVPARELDGFAYTQNQILRPLSLGKDLLHAWPEYFDESKGWVMVDPTWENTSGGVDYFNKFDLNHVVLAIKGSSSQSPYISDDVKVTISDNDFLPKPQIDLRVDAPSNILAGFPIKIKVRVANTGHSVLPPAILSIKSGHLSIKGDESVNLESIPAFGYTDYQFELKSQINISEPITDELEVWVGDKHISKSIHVQNILSTIFYPYLAVGLVLLFGSIYGGILLIHLFRRSKR